MVVHYAPPLNQTSVQQAFSHSTSSVSTTVQTTNLSTQQKTTVTSSIVLSNEVPVFHSGLTTTSTNAPCYTGTGRPTYSHIVSSDGRARRSKQGASLPPRRPMRFTASRMCCSGDDNIVRVEQEDTKSDEEYDTTAETSVLLINS